MFANTQMAGVDLGFPDVCLTPPLAIPVPYPNTGQSPLGVPPVPNVLFGGAPSHNLATIVAATQGDTGGEIGGVSSGTCMSSSQHVTGAFTVLLGGMPATRMTSIALQNMGNCVGARLVPSQTKVLLLAP
jgi:hypothetical protein